LIGIIWNLCYRLLVSSGDDDCRRCRGYAGDAPAGSPRDDPSHSTPGTARGAQRRDHGGRGAGSALVTAVVGRAVEVVLTIERPFGTLAIGRRRL
jgi:hypothetical protein